MLSSLWRACAVLAVAAACVLSSTARADVVIAAQVDGGTWFTVASSLADPSPDTGQVTWSGQINTVAFSNSPAVIASPIFQVNTASTQGTTAPGEGDQFGATTSIKQVAAGIHKITFAYGVNNYFQPPTGPALASSSISGTIKSAGTHTSIDYAAYLNNLNSLPSPPPAAPAGSTLIFSGSTSDSGGLIPPIGNTAFPILTAVATPFSLIQVITVTLNGLNQTMNFSSSTNVVAFVVPEPGSIALALTGLPLLAGGAWLRRRRTHS